MILKRPLLLRAAEGKNSLSFLSYLRVQVEFLQMNDFNTFLLKHLSKKYMTSIFLDGCPCVDQV